MTVSPFISIGFYRNPFTCCRNDPIHMYRLDFQTQEFYQQIYHV